MAHNSTKKLGLNNNVGPSSLSYVQLWSS